jgi:AcrR family transcriptional regulator
MARRAGLNRETVIDAAVAILDRDGVDGLSIAQVAHELSVRPPSLYHHVDGLDDLRRCLTVRAHELLGLLTHEARAGLTGTDALVAQCHAYRRFSREHPGCYTLLNVGVATPEDPELWNSMLHSIRPVIDSVTELGLRNDALWEALRLFRAGIHGFLSLELASGFGFDLDVDRSYDRLIAVLVSGLQAELT